MRNEEHQTSGRAEITEIRSVPAGGSDEEDVSSNGPEKEVSTILRQVHSEHPSKALPVVQSGSVCTPPPTKLGVPILEGSSTDESCSAYVARKWEQLGATHEFSTSSQGVVA